MGLETGSFISDLNASNPIDATDQVSQGDDHIRLIKAVLKSQFPNLNAAVNFTPTEANYLDGLTGVTGTGNLVASGSPTFTGTLTAAAIAATTYDGVAAANLLDKSAVETVTGAWTFSGTLTAGALTATTFGGIASANLLDKSASETVSGQWNFSTGPQLADIELGHASDTTITRSAAGKVEVEGRPIIAHNNGAFGSGEVYVSTIGPTGGSDGDIWLEREA
jgi:hypothetical protein